MDPVPNEAYWLEAIDRSRPTSPLSGERKLDVVCVGGGYTSLVTAYLLKKRDPGLRVAVLESHYIGFGSSGRNAGMVLQEPHLERVAARGADAVRFTYDETVRSVDFIEELTREEGFDCELERNGFLDIALLPEHERENEEKRRRAASVGIELETVDRGRDAGRDRERALSLRAPLPQGGVPPPGQVRRRTRRGRAEAGRRDLRRDAGDEPARRR